MIEAPKPGEQVRQSTNHSSSAHLNGCPSPSKSSSSDTNNTDSANQLTTTSTNSSSSNETVIRPHDQRHRQQQQQQPQQAPPAEPVANGALGERDAGELPGGRPRSKSLKSLFIQFAGQHLSLFHHNHHHSSSNSNNNSWTPTKQRVHHGKRAAAQPNDDQHGPDECAGQPQPASQHPNGSHNNNSNNFLVSFAQKCFHLNWSSSAAAAAVAASQSAVSTSGRNCHSCPVTPMKQPLSESERDEDGQQRWPNGCSEGGRGDNDEEEAERRAAGSGKRSLLLLHEHGQSAQAGSKRPQVRFVVDSSGHNSEQQWSSGGDADGPDGERDTSSESGIKSNGAHGGGGGKQRNYFNINKHIRPARQARVKLSDCGSQTMAARSLLDEQAEFVEDDEERARLVELMFRSAEGDDGAAAAAAADAPPPSETSATLQSNHHQRRPGQPMNSSQFRDYGYRLIDYICNYLDTIRQRRVTPINIEPGYLKSLIKPSAPEQGEPFSAIMHDFENHIMCGITHWQHPHFHAYFPAGNAYPSILADMLSDALGCVGFSWAASPAYTELEIIMLDWMGKMIGLPDEFLCLAAGSGSSAQQQAGAAPPPTGPEKSTAAAASSSSSASRGGGVIQGSASECVLVSMLAARHWAMDKLRKKYPGTQDGVLLTKLIGYCSKEAHSCVEKAAMIGFIRMRALDTDDKHSLRGDTLRRAIEADVAQGLEPFIVCATLGTTSCVSFDNLRELGEVCRQHDNLWLHVDAAYAGSALICPEFKYLIDGIELATSFNMNPNKWMLINFDCSLMWVKDRFKLTRAFVVDPLYLQHSFSDQAIDYRHWGIPLSRRFRALKLWFVIRNYGVDGLRAYIRNHVRLAKLFESLIREDKRFVITNEVVLGLVCFRLIGSNALNQRLLSMLNASGKLHMVPASLNGRYIIRFCVCDQNAKAEDIHYAYECIAQMASELFELIKAGKERIRAISQQNTIDVSSISLHTQQSASADRLNGSQQQQEPVALDGQPGANQQVAAGGGQLARMSSLAMRRTENGDEEPPAARTPIGRSPLGSRSPRLTKQASIRAGAEHAPPRPVSGLSAGAADGRELEDLEQEVPIGSLAASADGLDENDEDDDDVLNDLDDLDEALLDELQDEGHEELFAGAAAASQQQSLDEQQLRSIINDSISPIQRGRLSRAGGSVRSSSTARAATGAAGGQADDADEAADELVKLADKRNRMSLRYKREFFVRVVSDPRVYRASISGDINAHTSSTSSLASQPVAPATATAVTGTAARASQPQAGQQQQQQGSPAAGRPEVAQTTTDETNSKSAGGRADE
jgi:glutamate/tyrosine decarboxylase-like PLP-dependent enzyme